MDDVAERAAKSHGAPHKDEPEEDEEAGERSQDLRKEALEEGDGPPNE